MLTPAAVADQVTVSDDEIAAYYKGSAARFTAPEARRASHILVAIKPGQDKAAAKAKAEAILAEVRKTPAEFAKIAKAKSEDPASAELGGDLDMIEKNGAMVKPVEDAIFSLKQGEISNLVESEYGFHILTVTQVKPSVVKPLDEVKGEIAGELKKQKGEKKYAEMADAFTNTVYEQSDSLKAVVDKLKLKVETAEGVRRTPSPAFGAAPFNNAKFLQALFLDETVKNKRNTQAVEVGPKTLISGRVVEYKPATKRPLAEVEGPIRQRVSMEEALKAARKEGEEKLAAAKKSGDSTGFGEAKVVSRSKAEGINPAAFATVMKADASKLPAYVGVEIPGQGYGVYRINKVQQPAQADAASNAADAERIGAMISQQEMIGFVEVMKQKAKVKIIRPLSSITTKEVD
jgi:peptidyl-prolyl cis-trans isomerase D